MLALQFHQRPRPKQPHHHNHHHDPPSSLAQNRPRTSSLGSLIDLSQATTHLTPPPPSPKSPKAPKDLHPRIRGLALTTLPAHPLLPSKKRQGVIGIRAVASRRDSTRQDWRGALRGGPGRQKRGLAGVRGIPTSTLDVVGGSNTMHSIWFAMSVIKVTDAPASDLRKWFIRHPLTFYTLYHHRNHQVTS